MKEKNTEKQCWKYDETESEKAIQRLCFIQLEKKWNKYIKRKEKKERQKGDEDENKKRKLYKEGGEKINLKYSWKVFLIQMGLLIVDCYVNFTSLLKNIFFFFVYIIHIYEMCQRTYLHFTMKRREWKKNVHVMKSVNQGKDLFNLLLK